MHSVESVIAKIACPNRAKKEWLDFMAILFSKAVQLGLDAAESYHTTSRMKLHKVAYYPARQLGLPSHYSRMAVNSAVSLARSFYGLRKKRKGVHFPKVHGGSDIGLGVGSYKLVQKGSRWILRASTGLPGRYVWLPLCVSPKFFPRFPLVHGDAKLFKRGDDWYVKLPVRSAQMPTGCSGHHSLIGVDLGIVQHAVVATPDRVYFFSGRADRRKREHFDDIRRRYQRHRRKDRVKGSRGKESRWMRDINHKISRQIVDIASAYTEPMIVLECLDGIRHRVRGSKRFNRMVSVWAFRGLVDFIKYKAARTNVCVVFVDPRGTSRKCPKCGHSTRSNRPDQGNFRCVCCNFKANADYVAARNIAAAGPTALSQGRSDTARLHSGQTGSENSRPDGAKVCDLSHTNPNPVSSMWESRH